MTSTPPQRTAPRHATARRVATRDAISLTCLALAAWLLGATAFAHDSPDAHWCSAADPTVAPPAVIEIGRFDFTGAQMRTFANQLANVPGSCGQVDHTDQWKCAKQIAERYCAALSETQAHDQAALPVLAGPTAALAVDHHQRYALAAGLYGACLVCDLHPMMTSATRD